MKIFFASLLALIVGCVPLYADAEVVTDQASDIQTDTSSFDNNLSSADDTVQKALDTLDDMSSGGGTWGSITGTVTDQTDLTSYLTTNYAPVGEPLSLHLDQTVPQIVVGGSGVGAKTVLTLNASDTNNSEGIIDLKSVSTDTSSLKIGKLGANRSAGTFGTYADAYIANTAAGGTYGNILLATNGAVRLSIAPSGDIKIPADSKKLLLGASGDASISYVDGTGLVINPQEVGSGVLSVLGGIQTTDLAGNGAGVVAVDNDGRLSWSAGGGGIALDDLSATSPLAYDNTTGVFSIDLTGYLTASDLTPYALLDGTNQPFTGNVSIDKTAPTFSLISNDDSDYATVLSRVATNRLFSLKNQVLNNVPTGATSYANVGGTGNRTPIITVTSNYTFQASFDPANKIVDGATATGGNAYSGSIVADNTYYTFDFGAGSSKLITETKIYWNNQAQSNQMQWQGSNDNTNWTNIGSAFRFFDASGSPFTSTAMSGNTTGYRYYRILGKQTSGWNASMIFYEIEFKISDATPDSVMDVNVLRSSDALADGEMGRVTLGDYSTSYGSFNVLEGIGHQFNILGVSQLSVVDGVLKPTTTNDIDLGTTALQLKNIYQADNGAFTQGTGNDVVIKYTGTNWDFSPVLATSQIVFNEGGLDTDFRIEGDTDANLFYLDAGNSRIGIGTATPTAFLHLKAGTATAGTSPLKFVSGTSLTAAEAGATEFTTDDLFFTITTGAARKRLLMADPVGGLTSTRVPFATTNGRLTDSANMVYATNRLSPTYLTLGAGTATAGTAPLKLTSGTPLTLTEAGAVEFFTDDYYATTTTNAGGTTSVDVLVVAGGGSGGSGGGGGGAGGLISSTSLVTPITYPVVVGTGGTGNTGTGNSGGNSTFNGLTAIGGGKAGYNIATGIGGFNGGSGGGAGAAGGALTVGLGTAGQGNNGGLNSSASPYATGGGGGANAVGANAGSGVGGNGGAGISNSITGSAVTYAGGGGGSTYAGTGTAGTGGAGGGGNGSLGAGGGDDGVDGLGGGGGGSKSGVAGGDGGDGVVIIKYLTSALTATGGTITTSGSYTIHTFTSSGNFVVTSSATPSGRRRIVLTNDSGGLTSGRVPFATTNGRLTDSANLTYDGNLNLISDSSNVFLGAGKDASLVYDGTNMVIDPKVVGSGVLQVKGGIEPDVDETYNLGKLNTASTGIRFNNIIGRYGNFDEIKEGNVYTNPPIIDLVNKTLNENYAPVLAWHYGTGNGSAYVDLTLGEYGGSFNVFLKQEDWAEFSFYDDNDTGTLGFDIGYGEIDYASVGFAMRVNSDTRDTLKLFNWGEDADVFEISGLDTEFFGVVTATEVKAVHKAADGTAAVADGTYTMGLGGTTNGTITIKDGLIVSLTECVA